MRKSMRKQQQQGLSLIEVVVTLFIMSVGFMGLASLQSTAVKSGLDVAKRSQVTWLVTELAERLRANTEVAGGLSAYPLTFTASGCETEVAASPQCNTIACTAAQMARKDIVDVFCGQTTAPDVVGHASDSLNLTQVSITCDGACSINSNYRVAISYDSQAVGSSETLDDRSTTGDHLQRTIAMTVRP